MSDMGGGESKEKVTKCDMRVGGSKFTTFAMAYFLHGPFRFLHFFVSFGHNGYKVKKL